MNVMTRGEKIDAALESAKRALINTLLVIWAVLTAFLGIGFLANHMEVEKLSNEIETMEVQLKESKEAKTTESYILVDGHKYMVVDTAW